MLDLQQLKCFVAVAETGSIARAAEKLHLSASPLSRQIMALESKLDLTLFLREGKRLQLSAQGRRYLPQCQSLLADAQRLAAQARDESKGLSGLLHIGYVDSALFHGVLPQAVQALKAKRPKLRMRLQAMRSAEQFAALRSGDIELGFTHRAPPPDTGLVSRRVAVDRFMLAMRATHSLVRARTLQAKALAKEEFLFLSPKTSPQGHADLVAACRRFGFTPNIQHEVSEPLAAMAWVAHGLGLCLIQAALLPQAPAEVYMRPLPQAFDLGLEIYLTTTTKPSALATQLWQLCPRC
ncbi:MAG: LysR family transcriptional regulator [Pseudomonadota bacterium]